MALTLGSAASAISLGGSFTEIGSGAISLGASITTASGGINFTNGITLAGGVTLNSSAGSGDITLSSTLNGAQTFVANAGLGAIQFLGNVGATTPLTSLSASGQGITLGALTNSATTMSYTGPVRVGAATVDIGSGTTTNVTITGTVDAESSLMNNLSVTATGTAGTITIAGAIGTTYPLGSLALDSLGALSLSSVGTGTAAGVTNGMTLTASAIALDGTVYNTSGSSQTFSSPTTLGAPTVLISNGNIISFGSTLNSASATPQDLDVEAGASSVTFTGIVGGTNPLGAVTINATGVTASNNFNSASINEPSSTGTNTFSGDISTTGAAGIVLNGTTISFDSGTNPITTTGGGPLFIAHTMPLTLGAPGSTINLGGSFTETGSGAVSLGANITTGTGGINFTNAITLSGGVTLNSSAGNGDITLSSTLNGAQTFIANAGLGSIQFLGNVGATTPLTSLAATGQGITLGALTNKATTMSYTGPVRLGASTVDIGSGTTTNVTITGTVDAESAMTNNLSVTSGAITITGAIGTTFPLGSLTLDSTGGLALGSIGTGTVPGVTLGMSLTATDITLNGTVYNTTGGSQTFSSPTTLGASTVLISNANPISFGSTLGGTFNLDLEPGGSTVSFTGIVGSPALGNVTIGSASSVTASANFSAASFNETALTGPNQFNGNLTTTGAAGIVIQGTTVAFTSPITTTPSGPLFISNTTSLALPAAATATLGGAFTETGGGAVHLGANITTTGDAISFADPVTLTASAVMSNSGGAGNIVFNGTVNGDFALNSSAGVGAAQFMGAVGEHDPLASLTASGHSVVQTSTVQTVGGVTYTGQTQLGGNITTAGSSVLITGSVVNSANVTILTNDGSVTITGTIDGDVSGTRSLTVTAGTSDATFGGVIGGGVPLDNFTATAHLISIQGVGGLNNGVAGVLTLDSLTDIDFNGTNYVAASQSYTTPNVNFFYMLAGTGTLFSSSSGPIDFIGGTIHLSASTDFFVTTSGQDLAFPALTGTSKQNVFINLGVGTANLGTIGGFAPGDIYDITVAAGNIVYNGPISSASFDHASIGSITNGVMSPLISATSFQVFNAITGVVGSALNPIQVSDPHSIVIAGSSGTADFTGVTSDGIIHCLPSNPPTVLTFNGVVQNCNASPVPPTPGPTPKPVIVIPTIPGRDYFVPWIYDPDYNFSMDFFFMPDLISISYIQPQEANLYGRKKDLIPKRRISRR